MCEVNRHVRVLELVEEGSVQIDLDNMERGILLCKT